MIENRLHVSDGVLLYRDGKNKQGKQNRTQDRTLGNTMRSFR